MSLSDLQMCDVYIPYSLYGNSWKLGVPIYIVLSSRLLAVWLLYKFDFVTSLWCVCGWLGNWFKLTHLTYYEWGLVMLRNSQCYHFELSSYCSWAWQVNPKMTGWGLPDECLSVDCLRGTSPHTSSLEWLAFWEIPQATSSILPFLCLAKWIRVMLSN